MPLSAYVSQKEKKKGGTRQSGCARKPQRFFVAFNVAQLGRPPKLTENLLNMTLGFPSLPKSAARARGLFFIFYFYFLDTLADTLFQK